MEIEEKPISDSVNTGEPMVEETTPSQPTEGSSRAPEALGLSETQGSSERSGAPSSNKRWYVVNTYSGYEQKVKTNLEQQIKLAGLGHYFSRVLIPTEDVLELKVGKKRVATRKFFPGYILVEMEMNDETWQLVRNVPKVSGFVGAGNTPVSLSDSEADQILKQSEGIRAKPKLAVSFESGETVKIIDGPFVSFAGVIEDVNEEKTRLKVMVTIFGRQTSVELDFAQVEKI